MRFSLCILAWAFFFSACREPLAFDQGASTVRTGELPRGINSLSAAECAACHPNDHADWKSSVHGQAFTNALFQDSFRIEPAVWCVRCHAPLEEQAMPGLKTQVGIVDPAAPDPPQKKALRAEGINCAACHIRDGFIYTASKSGAEKGEPYHPMKYSAYLKSSEFCAGCHQFNFPYFDKDRVIAYGPAPMQDTYHEWRASPVSLAITCNECHGSPADHKVYGPHTPGWIEKKVTISARRLKSDLILVHLTLHGIPHSFPTGDLFRGIDFDVEAGGRRIGRRTFGRKTGDFKDAGAPSGIYKKFYEEKVLRPDYRGSISADITIPLDRPMLDGEEGLVRMIYFFRNREAERTLPPDLSFKEIANAPVREERHVQARRSP